MAKSVFGDLLFHKEKAPFEYVEKQLWLTEPVCPHCQATGEKIGRLTGKTARTGLRKCYTCYKQFTVRPNLISGRSLAPGSALMTCSGRPWPCKGPKARLTLPNN